MKTPTTRFTVWMLCPLLLVTGLRAAPEEKKEGKARQEKSERSRGQEKRAEPSPKRPARQAKPKPQARKQEARPAPNSSQKQQARSPEKPARPAPKTTPRPQGNRPETGRKPADPEPKVTGKRPATKETARSKPRPTPTASKRPLALPGKRPPVTSRLKPLPERRAAVVQKRDANQARPETRRVVGKRPAPVSRPGQNTRQIRRPVLVDDRKATNRRPVNRWWVNNNRTNITNVRNVNVTKVTRINRNFRENVNWNTRRANWGYNPWWNRTQTRPWYGSTWRGGWSRKYYRSHYPYHHYHHRPPGYSSVGASIGWGLVGWSLGTMVYDMGYRSYHNPYPVMPVSYDGGEVSYRQPITRVAVSTAPPEADVIAERTEASESLVQQSQDAFKENNYLVALEFADKAIAQTPGDGALHEYRALVLFALGKYGEAAGTLNPVLASGPGWDYPTMLALYDTQDTYTAQLTRLEEYTGQDPDKGGAHFLLGYHYMVTGHMDLAAAKFDRAHEITPKDNVARELAQLARSSADDGDQEAQAATDEKPAADDAAPEPVPLDKLAGTWTSDTGDGKVTLEFKNDGKFTWRHGDSVLDGEYSMNDDGQLVLDSEDNQMVAAVTLPEDDAMTFVLAGGPPEDPGLDFKKS